MTDVKRTICHGMGSDKYTVTDGNSSVTEIVDLRASPSLEKIKCGLKISMSCPRVPTNCDLLKVAFLI